MLDHTETAVSRAEHVVLEARRNDGNMGREIRYAT